jgi:hypothetical protein
MANTFNLGNGSWAQKTEKLLAFNSENDNYKPLPFDFDRASSATRVNKQGLIETVGTDKPRIDFLNNTKGHLLLEPFRRNIADYSEDGTEWNATNVTVSLDSSINKPDGIAGAYKVTDNTTNGQHRVDVRPTVVNGTQYAFSAFVKQVENSDVDFMYLLFTSKFTTTRVRFNLSNGTATGSDGTIENYGNGWYRVSATATANADGVGVFGVNLMDADSGSTYAGTGNGAMYVFGMQVEDSGSGGDAEYATSYIPTQGSAVTRSGETLVQDNMLTSLFNRQGMAFYLEVESLANDSATKSITINDGSGTDRFVLQLTGNQISTFTISSLGSTGFSIAAPNTDTTQTNKVAASFNASNGYLYINGTQIDVDTISNVIGDDLSKISFGNHALVSNIFHGKIKDYKIYNTALTPAELTALTS